MILKKIFIYILTSLTFLNASDEVLTKKLNDKEIKYTLTGNGCHCYESQVEFILNEKKEVSYNYNYIRTPKGCGFGYFRTRYCTVEILSKI